jgi:flavin reductase (DIM6/NTAB) family NADH-FMN oxidoreductase RutF
MNTKLADLFKRVSLGVYVVGVTDSHRKSAFTAAWITQVSFNPLLLLVSVNPHGSTYPLLESGGVFSVNVLGQDQPELARHFGTPGLPDKLAGLHWQGGVTGCPLLDDALAWFECEVSAIHPAGDHVIVLGQVVAGELRYPDRLPLIYRDTGNMDGAERFYPLSL